MIILWGSRVEANDKKAWGLGSVVATLVLVTLSGSVARAQECTSETIYGSYAFRISGQIFGPGGSVTERDGVAITHFDGVNGLTQEDYVMSEGIAVPGPTDPVSGFHTHESGTYVVNPDCTGSAVINFPAPPGVPTGAQIKLMFVVSNHGQVIHTIVSQATPPGSSTAVPANIHSDAEKIY